MTFSRGRLRALLIAACCILPVRAQVSLTSSGTTYTQNFNTIAATGTSSTLPAGWAIV